MLNIISDRILHTFFTKYSSVHNAMKNSTHHCVDKAGNITKLNPFHLEGDVLSHTLMVYNEMYKCLKDTTTFSEKEIYIYLLSALCHDFGKPFVRYQKYDHEKNIEKTHFSGHEIASCYCAIDFIHEFSDILSKDDIDTLIQTIAIHLIGFKQNNLPDLCMNNISYMPLMAFSDNRGRIAIDNTKLITMNMTEQTVKSRCNTGSDVILMMGIPASGKSTYVESLDGYEKFSADTLLMKLANEMGIFNYSEAHKHFSETLKRDWPGEEINNLLRFMKVNPNVPVVYDATNLSKRRKALIHRIDELRQNRRIKIIFFIRSMDKIMEGRSSRGDKYIPMNVYHSMLSSFIYPRKDECDSFEIHYVRE